MAANRKSKARSAKTASSRRIRLFEFLDVRGDGGPNRRRYLPHASCRPIDITIEAIGLAGAEEDLGGLLQYGLYRRVVGHHKRRKQLGHCGSAPLRLGERLQ